MTYSLGIDIGSVNVKLALIDQENKIVRLDTEKVTTSSQAAVASLIGQARAAIPPEQIGCAAVSGSATAVVPKHLNWSE